MRTDDRPAGDAELLDPVLGLRHKGYPRTQPPRRRSEVGVAGWNVLAGDLPLPLAVLKREALEHNLAWMQAQVRQWGVELVPHGKTTMSPQLFQRQLDAGAWGLTLANVTQASIGVAAGARRVLIANQVVGDDELAGLQQLLCTHEGLRIVFLVDSVAQLVLIEQWFARHARARPFEVLLELGLDGARTGCRTHAQAVELAARLRASPAVRLVGIETYEGQGAVGDSTADRAYTDTLMDRVDAVAREAVAQGWFECDEVLVSAGGSAIYDIVSARLTPAIGKPVRGLLRSGCYVTHDHGTYQRYQVAIDARLGCDCGDSLRAAMEVWALVQSRPEPGLAILSVGKRDISFDLSMPVPIARAARGQPNAGPVPAGWRITALNDQHAYLRWDAPEGIDPAEAPPVGERIGLGISHPCTTFDKWHWMPVVENDYRVSDAVVMHF